MEFREVEVSGGIRIAAHLSGDAALPPMVLLHALGERADDWAAVGARFASSYRVVALDLRGHGRSDWPGDYGFELMRDDVIGALDALGLREVVLVGHSMGGVVAYLVAQARPDRVARLVIEDACPPYPRSRPVPTRPDGPLDFDWAAAPAISAEVGDPTRRWWPALAEITAPTLVLGGGPTSHVPQDLLAEVAELIPDCTLVTVPAGHEIHRARPDEFAETVLGWLRQS
ncbi:alpha/beta fold hydrolase [Agromyces bauzanensis]